MFKFAIALVLAVTACGGNDGNMQTQPDAPTGPACTKAVFDNCVNNTDCNSNNCHFYMQQNFSVCTQACTPGDNTTCPVDSSGQHATCNTMGICKPAAANNCHL